MISHKRLCIKHKRLEDTGNIRHMAKPLITPGSKIGANVARLIDRHPHIKTQTALAAATGIAQSTIGRLIRGESMPSADFVNRIANALGADVREIYGEEVSQEQDASLRPILTWEHQGDLPIGEFALIRRLSVKLSAGNGNELVEISMDESKQPQAFRADWIRKMGLKPDKLACMEASGDSMEPRIQNGDALVLDMTQKDVVDGKVYGIWYDGGERVKRLYRLPGGGLRIKSDNDQFDTIDIPAGTLQHIRILGRVVHVSGEGGL